MKKNSILVINYYWPPCGGPAVQRWLDFTNRLVRDGYEVHVLTIDEKYATFASVDHTLVEKIDPRIKVHTAISSDLFGFYKKYIGKGKVPGNAMANEPNPNILQKVARFVRGNFLLPDPRKGWNPYAFEKAKAIIGENHIQKIVTAGPPHSSHLIGLKLKKELGLFWLADLHDFWTDVFYLKKFYRTRIANWFDARMEKAVLDKADIVLSDVDFGTKLYTSKISHSLEKFHTIRIGFEDSLFEGYIPNTKQTKFKISYAGTLPENYHPTVFFESLSLALKRVPNIEVELVFAGTISDTVKSDIQKFGLEKVSHFLGYVPFKDAIQMIKDSTVLLLINPDIPQDHGIVPGKLYEYFATKHKTISISSHQSENEMLINQLSAGKNFERHELESMTSYISELFEYWLIHRNCIYDQSDRKVPYSREDEYQLLQQFF